ncbi:MAG: hypothetical protein ACWA41_07095 [Putridiphycobacter sp.]
MKLFLSLSLVGLFWITSCTSDPSNDNENVNHNVDTTTVQIDTITIDTTSVLPDSLQEAGYVDETEEIEKEIAKKYGEQWDFCDCVVKNDSINKVFENPDLTDEEFDAAFARMEVIDNHCKELITAPNTTPEERSKHKRKVNKCLKNAGIK